MVIFFLHRKIYRLRGVAADFKERTSLFFSKPQLKLCKKIVDLFFKPVPQKSSF
jgi:hypothetical protein